MILFPKPWTHHHHLRLFHFSFFAIFSLLSLVAGFGLGVTLTQISAQTLENPAVRTATTSATVPEISSGGVVLIPKSVTTTPGGLAFPADLITNSDITLTVKPKNNNYTIEKIPELSTGSIINFKTKKPILVGKTNLINSFIIVELQTSSPLQQFINVDKNGNWQWSNSDPLEDGYYTLLITVVNKDNFKNKKTINFSFGINLSANQENSNTGKTNLIKINPNIIKTPIKPSSTLETILEKPSLVWLMNVEQNSKKIKSGDKINVNVWFKSTYKDKVREKLEFIISSQGREVEKSSEIVEIEPGESNFIKTFTSNIAAEVGEYDVRLQVVGNNITYVSTDIFEIFNNLSIENQKNFSKPGYNFAWLFEGLVVLLAIFSFIAFYQYRRIMHLTIIINKSQKLGLGQSENKNDK